MAPRILPLILSSFLAQHKFDYPMALSGLGLLFSSVVSVALVQSGLVQLDKSSKISCSFYVRNLIPIGASMAVTLAAGNAVYLYLPVGFIQMLKAFTPVVTLVLLAISGIELPVSHGHARPSTSAPQLASPLTSRLSHHLSTLLHIAVGARHTHSARHLRGNGGRLARRGLAQHGRAGELISRVRGCYRHTGSRLSAFAACECISCSC